MASHKKIYVYNLPYFERKQLCEVLNLDHSWKDLGAHMNYDKPTLDTLGRESSPSDTLLHKWSTENHSVDELFRLLHKIGHFWAMSIIVKLVRPELRGLLRREDDSVQNIVVKDVNMDSKGAKEVPEKKVVISAPEDNVLDANVLDGPLQIPYIELERVTNGWSDSKLLGRGGFGMVYRAVWLETEVAIKRIKKQGSVHNQSLFTELKSLSSMVHENILPLYGYSRDGEYGCLVYQFMVGGTVEDRLQLRGPASAGGPLTWPERHSIAVGVARGLYFLHCAREKPLVHGDIKSANILLDPRLVPKIGDFGLTRLGPSRDVTSVRVSQVHGTKPYLPGELLRSGKLSIKVDTYSFGVVLMELATGQRAWNPRSTPQLLRDVVLATTSSDEVDSKLADTKAPGSPLPTARHLLAIARVCCDDNPKLRPMMQDVLQRLVEDCRQTRQCATCSTRLVGSQSPEARSLSPHPPQRTPSPALLPLRTPSPAHPSSPVQQIVSPAHSPVNQMYPNHLSPPLQVPPFQVPPQFQGQALLVQTPYQGQQVLQGHQVLQMQKPYQGQQAFQVHQVHQVQPPLQISSPARPNGSVNCAARQPSPTKESSSNEPLPETEEVECSRSAISHVSSSLTSVTLESRSDGERIEPQAQEPQWMPSGPDDPFSLPLVSLIHGGQPEVHPTERS